MDNSQFAKEFSQASAKAGHAKSLAKAVGMPDAVDKEFIAKLIARHEKHYPGEIQAVRSFAQAQHQAQGGRRAEWNEINAAARGRLMVDLPPKLYHAIERHYPTMFISKEHLRWLCQNFPGLAVVSKS
jgi:hypothetical protein